MNQADRTELTHYLDNLYATHEPKEDPSNNGLQVEGNHEVRTAFFGVDACAELFTEAADACADFIFVHHGISWGSGFRRVTGMTAARIGLLLRNNISLYACHLPLDRHPEHGHNALIAQQIGLRDLKPFFKYSNVDIGCYGTLTEDMDVTTLQTTVENALNTQCRTFINHPKPVRHIGIVSGGGADALEACAALNVDCLITGEMEHKHYHVSKETGVNLIVGGHYRTEVPGIIRARDLVEQKFGIRCVFHDIPSGL